MATKAKKQKKVAEESSFTFTSKNGTETSNIKEVTGDCKAQKVVLGVLSMGEKPGDLDLRFAKSYGAHYLQKKGKNALGFFDTKDVLVVNAIADDLKKEGVSGIIQPSKTKNYKAIKLTGMEDKDIKALISKIARVLGFTGKKAGDSKPASAAPATA